MKNRFDYTVSTAQRPTPIPRTIRNPLVLAASWLSKTDPRLVALCSSWAIATQAAFGVFVLFTASLAFGAAHYTLSTIGASPILVPWIALAWAVFIGLLEREIAGSLDRTAAFVRPVLALFMGTLAAIPIELYIFEARVDQQLQRQYLRDNESEFDQLHAAETRLEANRSGLETELRALRQEEVAWGNIMDQELAGRSDAGRTGIRGAGPVFENAQSQQLAVRRRMQEVREDLNELARTMTEDRRRLEETFRAKEVPKTKDFVSRYEALDVVIHSSDPLFRLSWLITIALVLIETTPAILKLLTPHVDYQHLVKAEIRENIARIDEISDRNYQLAMENPEQPQFCVSEKFARVRYSPVSETKSFRRDA